MLSNSLEICILSEVLYKLVREGLFLPFCCILQLLRQLRMTIPYNGNRIQRLSRFQHSLSYLFVVLLLFILLRVQVLFIDSVSYACPQHLQRLSVSYVYSPLQLPCIWQL